MAQAQVPLTPFHPNMKHSERERYICIYPAYLNSKKTKQEGRKLNKENCVENPTFQEIKDVLTVTNLNLYVENKIYPRERSKELLQRGRIRVQIKNDDGTAINPEFNNRNTILLYVGKMIPQLKSRQANPRGPGAELPAGPSSSTSNTSNKKKNKKR